MTVNNPTTRSTRGGTLHLRSVACRRYQYFTMAKKGAPVKKAKKRPESSRDSTIGQGVAKKKHALVAGSKRAVLAKRLEAEEASSKAGPSAKVKARKAKAANGTILSAVDGMKASLDELLTANEQVHRKKAEVQQPGGSLTSKRRQKLVAEETRHMQAVLQHPAFVADPFGALQEHLSNTMAAMEDKAKDKDRGGGPSHAKRSAKR